MMYSILLLKGEYKGFAFGALIRDRTRFELLLVAVVGISKDIAVVAKFGQVAGVVLAATWVRHHRGLGVDV